MWFIACFPTPPYEKPRQHHPTWQVMRQRLESADSPLASRLISSWTEIHTKEPGPRLEPLATGLRSTVPDFLWWSQALTLSSLVLPLSSCQPKWGLESGGPMTWPSVHSSDKSSFTVVSLYSYRHPGMRKWPRQYEWFFMKMRIEHIWLLKWYGGVSNISKEEYFKAVPRKAWWSKKKVLGVCT